MNRLIEQSYLTETIPQKREQTSWYSTEVQFAQWPG